MKKISTRILLSFCLSSFIVAVHADELTVHNNFEETLNFDVPLSPSILPDFPANFALKPGEFKTTRVNTINDDSDKMSLVDVFNAGNRWVLFGIKPTGNSHDVYPYNMEKLAISWNKKNIALCSEAHFTKTHSCFR